MAELVVRGIVKRYGDGAHAVRRASFGVGAGELVAIAGPTRAGKSTLLRVVAGLVTADAGHVEIGSRSLSRGDPTQVAAVGGRPLDEHATVLEEIGGPLRRAGIGERELLRRTHHAAELLGIGGRLDGRLRALDTAQLRRVELARAIALEPDAIVIDDALSELPTAQRVAVLEELLRLRGSRGTSILYATSDPQEALSIGDRVVMMEAGAVEQVAAPDTIVAAPATASLASYLHPDLQLHSEHIEGRPVLVGERQRRRPMMFDAITRRNLDVTIAEPPRPLEGPAREAAAAGAEPRYVNVWLEHRVRRLAGRESLRVRTAYDLHVDIGPFDAASVVGNAREAPFPDSSLPESDEGHWLQLVASSSELKLAEAVQRIFLPLHGSAWICDCPSDAPHVCAPQERRPCASFSLRSPARAGIARLRLTLYHRLNAVQSLLLEAHVGRRGGHACTIDYSLTSHLADVGRLRPRALALVLNEDSSGAHHLYVNDGHEPFDYQLADTQVSTPTRHARRVLHSLQFVGNPALRRSAYGRSNEKKRRDFEADLLRLARVGRSLLTGVFPIAARRRRLVEALRAASAELDGSAVVHVAGTTGNTLAFPWHLVYDIPLAKQTSSCPWLAEWEPPAAPDSLPARCPHEHEHVAGTICPFGFWGFAHRVETPPFVDVGVPSRETIRSAAGEQALRLAVGASRQLPPNVTSAHLKALGGLVG